MGASAGAPAVMAGQAGMFGMQGGRGGPPMMRFPVGSHCGADSDCTSGSWCTQGTCSACDSQAASNCREGFSPTARNGCSQCAPPNECVTDASCGDGMTCFAGSQCEPGCQDLTCCHGNLCGDSRCSPPDQLDCSVVGCPDGDACMGSSQAHNCRCDAQAGWMCDMSDGPNQCAEHQN